MIEILFGHFKGADITQTRLKDGHNHTVNIEYAVKHLQRTNTVNHHLCVVDRINLHAFAVLEVDNMNGRTVNDDTVGSTETAFDEPGEINLLFNKHQRLAGTGIIQKFKYIVTVLICTAFHFLAVIIKVFSDVRLFIT